MEKFPEWEGSVTSLLDLLNAAFGDRPSRVKYWPKDSSQLSKHLRKLESSLAGIGLNLLFSKGRKGRSVKIVKSSTEQRL